MLNFPTVAEVARTRSIRLRLLYQQALIGCQRRGEAAASRGR